MPEVLRFGVHSLDELLGVHPSLAGRRGDGRGAAPGGIYLPRRDASDPAGEGFTTSVCIIGPDGTGKSIFALHMASRYVADCAAAGEPAPTVLYVSTDLTYNMAQRVWRNFALDYPSRRKDPFGPASARRAEGPARRVALVPCEPLDIEDDFGPGADGEDRVTFVDMAAHTAGDDWGFLHKLLSLMSPPAPEAPRHLVVIDAIEGFETLAGELNSFGEKSTRRSRIAQVMRLAGEKCHVLFVVEESRTHERLAEEFIADTVIRLENLSTRNYERRVLRIDKVRGQSHVRGPHPYAIRSGNGSTTGTQVNPDDPAVEAPPRPASELDGEPSRQCYVHVFHSIHRMNRMVMERRRDGRPKQRGGEPGSYAAFGIKYLDNMLGGRDEVTRRRQGRDTRGLPSGSTTALIGDSLTQKSTLGRAFLSRCFYQFDERLGKVREAMRKARDDQKAAEHVWNLLHRKVLLASDAAYDVNLRWGMTNGLHLLQTGNWAFISAFIHKELGFQKPPFALADSADEQMTHLGAWLLDYAEGLAVMLVTHNTDHERLAENFVRWLHTEEELAELNGEMKGYEQALRRYLQDGTICRRLEIHDVSSEVLVHIFQQVIRAAQRKILTREEMASDERRRSVSWAIRVVMDDFSTFRHMFPELREDPLLLPSILFNIEREGVTTLIVDTQAGKPETPIAERFESELRQMVEHNLYTWRVPFYGESRVAITAIPPLSYEYAGIVRELRWQAESPGRAAPSASEPATVDPHFELYAGLEEGRPQPVPLRVRFYEETPAMRAYIEAENRFLDELFVPVGQGAAGGPPSVIVGVPAENYNELRDLAYLQRDTRLDHALIFQVDEFWTMRAPSRRKRAGAFHPVWSYLDAITAEAGKGKDGAPRRYEPDPNVDSYKLFQHREEDPPLRAGERYLRRHHFYTRYYEDFPEFETDRRQMRGKLVDRVPFTWDFGFLLCRERAWDIRKRLGDGGLQVRDVWHSLVKAKDEKAEEQPEPFTRTEVSWRLFVEACKKAAERQSDKMSKTVAAFDFAQISPESFSCLILEMWFSEIYDTLKRAGRRDEMRSFAASVSSRRLVVPADGGHGGSPARRLSRLLDQYWLELYKSWLLLIEIINFSDIVGEATALNFDFRSKNSDFSAVATRHWYKTASQCPSEVASREPLVAVRLPGHFSVRGDWFLAVSGSSRSVRQAERALDLLNSRRANVTRLQLGLGLPTRAPRPAHGREPSLGVVRTKLISHEWGQDNVEYSTFLKIAAPRPGEDDRRGEEFFWLWRSSLEDYAQSSRIWHKWLNRTLLWWYRKLLRYKSVWINSFQVYDRLTDDPPPGRDAFAPTDPSEIERTSEEDLERKYKVKSHAQLIVRSNFMKLLDVVREELKHACEASGAECDEV